jgi:hypothetical protein
MATAPSLVVAGVQGGRLAASNNPHALGPTATGSAHAASYGVLLQCWARQRLARRRVRAAVPPHVQAAVGQQALVRMYMARVLHK